jgi:3-dehydroquinate dehydratase
MSKLDDNIIFFLEEKSDEKDNSGEIEKMLYELEDTETEDLTNYNLSEMDNDKNIYYSTKKMYDDMYGINNEEVYQLYTVKRLLRICDYYDIEKNIKMAKYKKQDIILSIVYFESLPENAEIVNKRHKLWSHITELIHDSKMKKYVIWD